MKIGVAVLTNRPDVFYARWLTSIHRLAPLWEFHDPSFIFGLEDFPSGLVDECKKMGPVIILPKNTDPCFHWAHWYEELCKLQSDCDVFLRTDDDFIFSEGTPKGRPTWHRYLDAINYMEKKPDCGAVMLKSFLGGSPFGNKIMPAMQDGLIYDVGQGLFLRNIKQSWFYALPELRRKGAVEECAAVFSRIENGYTVARGFNCALRKIPTKGVCSGAVKLSYEKDWINSEGIGAAIRERYEDPNWDYNDRYIPAKLREMHDANRH